MTHPLSEIMAEERPLLLIGDSDANRFPGMSYHCYATSGREFYCLDLGKLASSRGFTRGGPVIHAVDELPETWSGDLAIIWVSPIRAAEATRVAAEAGCTRIWYSFQTATPEAVELARELGLDVVEIGRCPLYFFEGQKPLPCRLHTAVVSASGTRDLPPQTTMGDTRRELI